MTFKLSELLLCPQNSSRLPVLPVTMMLLHKRRAIATESTAIDSVRPLLHLKQPFNSNKTPQTICLWPWFHSMHDHFEVPRMT